MKKKIIVVGIAAIVAILGIVFGIKTINKAKEEKAIETIKTEYSKIVDEKISKYLSRSTDELNRFEKEYQITNINYDILDVSKKEDYVYGDVYVISIEVHVESANSYMTDTEYSLLNFDVEEDIFTLGGMGITSNFDIAGYTCTYEPPLDGSYTNYDARVSFYVNDKLISGPKDTKIEKTNSDDVARCKSCGNKYKKGSENAKSISRTNMCTKCYKSYKTISDWVNEQPVD